jgi:hypothetical protein
VQVLPCRVAAGRKARALPSVLAPSVREQEMKFTSVRFRCADTPPPVRAGARGFFFFVLASSRMAKKKDSPLKIALALLLAAAAIGLVLWQNDALKGDTGGRPAQLP